MRRRKGRGVVKRKRRARQREPLPRLEPPLGSRPFETLVKRCNQLIGCVADPPEAQVVELRAGVEDCLKRLTRREQRAYRTISRDAGYRGPVTIEYAYRQRNDIGPGKVESPARSMSSLIKRICQRSGKIGSDNQQALGRHERPYAGHERKRMSESAEGRRVGWKDAKDISAVVDGNRALQTDPLTPTSVQNAPVAAGCPPALCVRGPRRR